MSAFEFLFTFYGLLLGLALSNVAVGFGQLWRLKAKIAVGWLTPLAAVYMIEMVLNLWLGAWSNLRDKAAVDLLPLVLMLATTLPLIFVSIVLFPGAEESGGSMDDHYLAHRKAIFAALALSYIAILLAPPLLHTATPDRILRYVIAGAPLVLAPVTLMFIGSRRLHFFIMSALVLYVGWGLA